MFTLQPLGGPPASLPWLTPTSTLPATQIVGLLSRKSLFHSEPGLGGLYKTLGQCKTQLTWWLTLKEGGAMLKEKWWFSNSGFSWGTLKEYPERSLLWVMTKVTYKAFAWKQIKLVTLRLCWAYLERNLHAENVKHKQWASHTHESTERAFWTVKYQWQFGKVTIIFP